MTWSLSLSLYVYVYVYVHLLVIHLYLYTEDWRAWNAILNVSFSDAPSALTRNVASHRLNPLPLSPRTRPSLSPSPRSHYRAAIRRRQRKTNLDLAGLEFVLTRCVRDMERRGVLCVPVRRERHIMGSGLGRGAAMVMLGFTLHFVMSSPGGPRWSASSRYVCTVVMDGRVCEANILGLSILIRGNQRRRATERLLLRASEKEL